MQNPGTNQSGMRQGNERLVLTLLRRHGPLPKAEIARMTGLSAQTVSVIMRALEDEGLLARGTPQRGRVGQPSVPMALAAEGAFFLGLKIGRRSSEMVLVDFLGRIRDRRIRRHDWPTPEAALDFANSAARELTETLPPALRPRIAGMGVALPFRLWDWPDSLGAPTRTMGAWRECDLRAALAARHGIEVFLENDATAACGAELVFGTTPLPADFLHAYVGFFVGGGLVLESRLFPGRRGNAGALGSLPVRGADGGTVQLLDRASTARLEAALLAEGLPADGLWSTAEAWDIPERLLTLWIEDAAEGLAQAAVAALALLDIEAMVIDGWMPGAIRQRLVAATDRAFRRQDRAGLEPLRLIEGSLGPDARPLGAAALPLAARYLT